VNQFKMIEYHFCSWPHEWIARSSRAMTKKSATSRFLALAIFCLSMAAAVLPALALAGDATATILFQSTEVH